MTVRFVICLLLLLLIISVPTFADDGNFTSQLRNEFELIENQVLSPYCPGRLLRDCPSSKASELKQSIRTDLSNGKSRNEIIENL